MFASIVESVFHYADQTPQALCAADIRQAFSYAQMKNAALFVAKELHDLGVKRGDCVLVECTQNAAYCACQMGLALIGAVFVPFDRKFSEDRLREMLEETEAVCLVGSSPRISSLPFFKTASISPDLPSQSFSYSFPKAEDRSEILYSTGTTGKSKGVDLTHGNNIAIAENIADGVRMESGNIELIPVSMSHSHALRTTYANFLNGNAVVISSGVVFLNPFFTLMERWRVTALDLVPSAWRIIRQAAAKRLEDFRQQIRYVELGSEPLTEEDKRSLRELLPMSRLYNFYGSTESGRSCTFDFAAEPGRPGCIGKSVCNAEVLIVDGDRRPLSRSSSTETGFLAFRGPMNMSGYWKNPELTASVMQDGIVYSKDVGYIDPEGWIYMMGREDDVINCGGVKISPEEIEATALQCPGVADCGCVGHADPLSGQAPWLYVKLAPDSRITADDVRAWLLQNMDRDKLPRNVIELNEIPRTFNGKILRRALRELGSIDTE